MATAALTESAVKKKCTRFLHGCRALSPADEFEAMAKWVREHSDRKSEEPQEFYDANSPDVYGSGSLMQQLERHVAGLLGKDAAVFMPSGVMAQLIALRVWTSSTESTKPANSQPKVALHTSSHLILHEHNALQELNGMQPEVLGSYDDPYTVDDLAKAESKGSLCSVAVVELPMRERGGKLLPWSELQRLKDYTRRSKMKLHMDGARLWETKAHYQKTYAEICEGFDSVYVSLYKGIGGLSGALLVGSEKFCQESRIWLRRFGGNLFTLHPYVVSAASRLNQRLASLQGWYTKAQETALAIDKIDGVVVEPRPPVHVNMFHLHFPFSVERYDAAHLQMANEEGVWLRPARTRPTNVFKVADPTSEHSHTCYTEVYVGDNIENVDIDVVVRAIKKIISYGTSSSK